MADDEFVRQFLLAHGGPSIQFQSSFSFESPMDTASNAEASAFKFPSPVKNSEMSSKSTTMHEKSQYNITEGRCSATKLIKKYKCISILF